MINRGIVIIQCRIKYVTDEHGVFVTFLLEVTCLSEDISSP